MDLAAWLEQARSYFRQAWGLVDSFAAKVALFYAYLATMGLEPRITSGFRDPKKQAEMLARWNAGDHQGLKFKPAANSDHTRGKAIDIVTNNPQRAAQIARALGLGTGLDYGDEVHFFEKV